MGTDGPAVDAGDGDDTDVAARAAKHISITPMWPNWNVSQEEWETYEEIIEGLLD